MSELKASYFKDLCDLSHLHDWEPGTQIHSVRPKLGFAPLVVIGGVVAVIAGVIAIFMATPFLTMLLDLNLDVWGWRLTVGIALSCGFAFAMALYSAIPFREAHIDWDLGTYRGIEGKQKFSRELKRVRAVVIQPMSSKTTAQEAGPSRYGCESSGWRQSD